MQRSAMPATSRTSTATPQHGGHLHPTFHGHSLQAGERVRRDVCCWFRQDTGAGWSGAKWSKVYITDSRLLIQSSGGALVSVWWTPSLRFFEDLTAGRVTCRHMRD